MSKLNRWGQTIEESFFSRVTYSDQCWSWDGYTTTHGYGTFHFNKMPSSVHRWSYRYFQGVIAPGKMICHHCDNRSCVNPFHLYEGDAKTNMQDAIDRGRQHEVRKTHCPRGHKYNGDNTYVNKLGHRKCRPCARIRREKYPRQGGE